MKKDMQKVQYEAALQDAYMPRDCAFEMITFLKGYYTAPTPFDRKEEIATLKECASMYHDQELRTKARGESPSLFVDAPAYYAIIARLLKYMPYSSSKDTENWAAHLTMIAHEFLYPYLETLCDIHIGEAKTLDLAVHETFDGIPQGADQIWHASAILDSGVICGLRIERRGTSFHVVELERTQEGERV